MGFFDSIAGAGARVIHDVTSDPVDFVRHGGVWGSALRHDEEKPSQNLHTPGRMQIIGAADPALARKQIEASGWPQAVQGGVGQILTDYEGALKEFPHLIPPLCAVAYPGDTLNPAWPWQLHQQDPRVHANGLLSRIVVHYWEHGVPGLQQYFGSVAGEYLGARGNFREEEFAIPLGDWLERVWVVYRDANGFIMAIRLRTHGGRDSGWIGTRAVNGLVFEYALPLMTAGPDPRVKLHPVLALDASISSPTEYLRSLAVRFTYPYRIVSNVHAKPLDGAHADPSAPLWTRTWKYANDSAVEQVVTLADTATVRTSHTVTRSQTESSSETNTLSIGASAMLEGITFTANQSTSTTKTRTTSTADSVTAEQAVTKYFEFPLRVAPRSVLEATVAIRERRHAETVEGRIEWDVPGGRAPAMKFAFEYQGTDDLDIAIALEQFAAETHR